MCVGGGGGGGGGGGEGGWKSTEKHVIISMTPQFRCELVFHFSRTLSDQEERTGRGMRIHYIKQTLHRFSQGTAPPQ